MNCSSLLHNKEKKLKYQYNVTGNNIVLFSYLKAKYRPASRDLKRIGSVSLSPIYSHFSDTINGLATIRAMKSAPRFIRDNEEKVEANQKASYASTAAQMWLEFRLQAVGCAVVTGIAIIAVIEHKMPNGVSPGLVGLAISYALGITSKLSGLVSAFTETEREMVAVERCHQYIEEIPEEDLDRKGTMSTPYGWPSEGIVHYKDVKFRYRDHLPLALKDFNLETKSREKVRNKNSLFKLELEIKFRQQNSIEFYRHSWFYLGWNCWSNRVRKKFFVSSIV